MKEKIITYKEGIAMKRFIVLLAGVVCVLAMAPIPVFAAGTPAGTVITNTATLNYRDLGGTAFPPVTATITITVAQQAGVAITPISAAQTAGDSTWVVYPFAVQNTGNGKDQFGLTAVSSNTWTTEIYPDLDGNGVLDPADLAAGIVSVTDSLLADSTSRFVARIFVPKGTADGTTDDLTVRAESGFNPTVFDSKVYNTTVQRACWHSRRIRMSPIRNPGKRSHIHSDTTIPEPVRH